MKPFRHALVEGAVLAAVVLTLAACAGKDHSPTTNPYAGMEVITAGKGIGTDLRPVVFGGQLVYRVNGELHPLSTATFKRHELPDRDPYAIEMSLDAEGRFESTIQLVTTVAGRRKWKRGTTIIIESPGCVPLRLAVADDWSPRTIELDCEVE